MRSISIKIIYKEIYISTNYYLENTSYLRYTLKRHYQTVIKHKREIYNVKTIY